MPAESPAVSIATAKISPAPSTESNLHKAPKMENTREEDVSEGTKIEINNEKAVKEESEAGKEPDTPPETPSATQTPAMNRSGHELK